MRMHVLRAAIVLAATGATVQTATAHPTLQTPETVIGKSYKAIMRIGHGCDGAATTKVRVLIPEGVIGVKPMPKPGWSVEIVRGPYAKSYKYYHGALLTEGPKELIWTGSLPDEHYDEFVFSSLISDTLAAGTRIHFPVYQHCGDTVTAWTQVPAAGQNAHSLELPAPSLMLTGSNEKNSKIETFKIGDIVIESPWIRATPGGARVAGGYLKITNNGQHVDRLLDGTLTGAATVEIHEMSTVDNMMRMRKLTDGLEIKPGQTVELKPGGYHVMFMGLTGALTEGQTIKGTLRLQKAGSIDVMYRVAPIGARSGGTRSHHHH